MYKLGRGKGYLLNREDPVYVGVIWLWLCVMSLSMANDLYLNQGEKWNTSQSGFLWLTQFVFIKKYSLGRERLKA